MKLYIIGGSGGVGKHVVEEAFKRGHEITVHGRNSSHISAPPSVKVVRRELASLGAFEGLTGHDAVISCVGNRRSGPGPYAKLRSSANLCQSLGAHLVSDMQSAGVKRLVAISAAGVGDSRPGLNFVMKFLLLTSPIGVAYRDLDGMEGVFAQSSLDWYCVRPVTLAEGRATGKVQVVNKFAASAKITRHDVAKFMVDRVEERWPFIAHTQQIANG